MPNPLQNQVETILLQAEENRQDYLSSLELIQEMWNSGFELEPTNPAEHLAPNLLIQVIKAMSEKIQIPSFSLHNASALEETQRIVLSGVEKILRSSGWIQALESDRGALEEMLLYGNSFITVGTTSLGAWQYRRLRPDQVLFGLTRDNEPQELLLKYTYTTTEARKHFGYTGRGGALFLSTPSPQPNPLTEIGYYYNLDTATYAIFAGNEGEQCAHLTGKDYPFWNQTLTNQRQNYLPLIHLKCFPIDNSPYARGIGHLIYRLAKVEQTLFNKGITQTLWNSNPMRMMQVPYGRKSSFMRRLKEAHTAQKKGLLGILINEVGTGEENIGNHLQTLSTEPLTHEWERVFSQIERTLNRFGLNTERISHPDKPLGVVEMEEERANEFIKDLLSQNITQFLTGINLALDYLRRSVWPGTPTASLPLEHLNLQEDGFNPTITLGQIAEELRQRNYWIEINTRSGTVNSRILQRIRRERLLSHLNPTSPAYKKILQQEAAQFGLNLKKSEL